MATAAVRIALRDRTNSTRKKTGRLVTTSISAVDTTPSIQTDAVPKSIIVVVEPDLEDGAQPTKGTTNQTMFAGAVIEPYEEADRFHFVSPDRADNFSDDLTSDSSSYGNDDTTVDDLVKWTAKTSSTFAKPTNSTTAIPTRDHPQSTLTSETTDVTKPVVYDYVVGAWVLEKAARDILCPVGGETIFEAIAAMEMICANALANNGAKWKSVVQDQDKFGLLRTQNHKFKIVFKTSMMLAVLAVIKFTLAHNLPPAFLKTCELAREYFVASIGAKNLQGVWIPQRITIYNWFRDFRTRGAFTHPEIKLHEKHLLLENLDLLFAKHPGNLIAFISHVKNTLRETKSELIDSSYSFYSHFAKEIAGSVTVKRIISESSSVEALASSSANHQSLLESYNLEKLTWLHLYDWMENKNFEAYEVKGANT